MKIIINQKILEKSLSKSSGIIDRKQTVPILGYVLMSASRENGLRITSTNMDMTVIDIPQCNVLEDGEYCLPASLLHDITKKIKSGVDICISFDSAANSVEVTSNKAKFSIHYMEKSKFPPIANTEYPVRFSIKAKLLKKSIDIVKVAMLQDNTRFHLHGIHIHHENDLGINKMRFVATDLFRVGCVGILCPDGGQTIPPIIVSKRTVVELLRLIESGDCEDIEVLVSEKRIAFNIKSNDSEINFSARLVNGTFPEYKGALDVSNDKILIVDTQEIVEALDRVSTVVMDHSNSVKLSISKDRLAFFGVSRELGTATEEIEASFNALEPLDICFNSRYLIEILRQIETPQVKFLLAEDNSSTIIEPLNDSSEVLEVDVAFAIMPVEIVRI